MTVAVHERGATGEAAVAGLRDAAWTDVASLVALEAELFPHDPWSEPSWWSELAARPRRDYVVVADEVGLLGYAGLDHGGDVADVMTVATAPRARGRGLGGGLLAELERRAAARGAEHVMLEVRADNAPARALYDRAGYVLLTTRRRYYQPGDVDALVLRKTLSGREIRDA
ncbi:ribosomal protein S18-alanine N-acetyltransferase [Oryzobacter telluris]|uniref:ribosomal protein S18-alanine N-acetyltransferase n=1 Tax=Oryzobacter telluris TaxID=3149179 RepID=UPI00370D54BA